MNDTIILCHWFIQMQKVNVFTWNYMVPVCAVSSDVYYYNYSMQINTLCIMLLWSTIIMQNVHVIITWNWLKDCSWWINYQIFYSVCQLQVLSSVHTKIQVIHSMLRLGLYPSYFSLGVRMIQGGLYLANLLASHPTLKPYLCRKQTYESRCYKFLFF